MRPPAHPWQLAATLALFWGYFHAGSLNFSAAVLAQRPAVTRAVVHTGEAARPHLCRAEDALCPPLADQMQEKEDLASTGRSLVMLN